VGGGKKANQGNTGQETAAEIKASHKRLRISVGGVWPEQRKGNGDCLSWGRRKPKGSEEPRIIKFSGGQLELLGSSERDCWGLCVRVSSIEV